MVYTVDKRYINAICLMLGKKRVNGAIKMPDGGGRVSLSQSSNIQVNLA